MKGCMAIDRQKTETVHWHAVFTASRAEKKVRDRLEELGVECFLPVQTVLRQWTYRKSRVVVPVIAGLVFVRVSRQEIRRDYICGGWTTPDLNRGLIISKLPEGFNAAIYAPPLNRKRTRLLRVFVRVDGDVLKACYDGVDHTITTNPLHDSITFPGYGTFLRDDQIFG